MGRPCTLIARPDKIKKLLEKLSTGLYMTTACDLIGISFNSVNSWVKKAEEIQVKIDDDDEYKPTDEEKPYLEFFKSIKKAQAEGVEYHVDNVNKAGKTNWQASMTMLERTNPDKYGRKDKVEVDANIESNQPMIVVNATVAVDPKTGLLAKDNKKQGLEDG